MWRAAASAPHAQGLRVGEEVAPGPHMMLDDAAAADDVLRRVDASPVAVGPAADDVLRRIDASPVAAGPYAAPSVQHHAQAMRAASMFVAMQLRAQRL